MAVFDARLLRALSLLSTFVGSWAAACGSLRGNKADFVGAEEAAGPAHESRTVVQARAQRFEVTTTFVGYREDAAVFNVAVSNRTPRVLRVDPSEFRLTVADHRGKTTEVGAIDPGLIVAQLEALAAGGTSAHAKSSGVRALLGLVSAIQSVADESPSGRAEHRAALDELSLEQQFAGERLDRRLSSFEAEQEEIEMEFLQYTALVPGQMVSGFVGFELPRPPRAVSMTIPLDGEDLRFVFRNRASRPSKRRTGGVR